MRFPPSCEGEGGIDVWGRQVFWREFRFSALELQNDRLRLGDRGPLATAPVAAFYRRCAPPADMLSGL